MFIRNAAAMAAVAGMLLLVSGCATPQTPSHHGLYDNIAAIEREEAKRAVIADLIDEAISREADANEWDLVLLTEELQGDQYAHATKSPSHRGQVTITPLSR